MSSPLSPPGPKRPSSAPPPAVTDDSNEAVKPVRVDKKTPPPGPPIDNTALPQRKTSTSEPLPQLNSPTGEEIRTACQIHAQHIELQCQLMGQKFLQNHIDSVAQCLDDPAASADDLEYILVYVKDDQQITVIPPETGVDAALLDSLRSQAKKKIQEVKDFYTPEQRQELDQKLVKVSALVEQQRKMLEQAGVPVPAIRPHAVPTTLNPARIHHGLGFRTPLPDQFVRPAPSATGKPPEFRVAPQLTQAQIQQKAIEWLKFCRPDGGSISDQRWTLQQIRQFGDKEMEDYHDFIQLLFPAPHQSEYNPTAPLLAPIMVAAAHNDPYVQKVLRDSVDQMLGHWGLMRIGDAISFDMGATAKHARWIGKFDHNHLRITRMLDCLIACGYVRCACNIERAMQDARHAAGRGINPKWRQSVQRAGDPATYQEFSDQ